MTTPEPLVPVSPRRLEAAIRFGDYSQLGLAEDLSKSDTPPGFGQSALSLIVSGQRKRVRASVRLAITDLTIGEPVRANAEWLGGGSDAIRVRVPEFLPLTLDTRMVVSGGRSERDSAQMLLIEGEWIALETRDDLDLDRLQLLRELLPLIPRAPQTATQRDLDIDDSLRITVPVAAIWGLSTADSWWNVLTPPSVDDRIGTDRDLAFRYGLAVLASLRSIIKPWVQTGIPIPLDFLNQLLGQWNGLSLREDRLFKSEQPRRKK